MIRNLLSKTQKPVVSAAKGLATQVSENANYIHPRQFAQKHKHKNDLATFTIKDGPVFKGNSFGAKRSISGEAVFTTSVVGYPESMTDPSYSGQILVFTQPLIGNYGVPSGEARDDHNLLKYFESGKIQAAGIICSDFATKYSHWTAVESLSDWCSREGVPAVSGVDTRAIVTYLREQGSSLAKINIGEEYDEDEDSAYSDPAAINLVRKVSTKHPYHIAAGGKQHIALIDCGVKENILRCLAGRGADVTVFPFDYPVQDVIHKFDGLFLSNGPGDPTHCDATVYNLRKTMEIYQGPIFGICLGHQLLALAAGAKTIKLKYGNRAHNIPCLNTMTGECSITSQNHGYAVDVKTLPSDWKESFINLNDQSNEGIVHTSRPIGSVQFHPEAKGGPSDPSYLFDNFIEQVRVYAAPQKGSGAVKASREEHPIAV